MLQPLQVLVLCDDPGKSSSGAVTNERPCLMLYILKVECCKLCGSFCLVLQLRQVLPSDAETSAGPHP